MNIHGQSLALADRLVVSLTKARLRGLMKVVYGIWQLSPRHGWVT